MTRMQRNLINKQHMTELSNVKFLIGDVDKLRTIEKIPSKIPFDDNTIDFLNELSKNLMSDKSARRYPDILTLGFWIRKSSMNNLKKRFLPHDEEDKKKYLGRGVLFHIAPSNVAVNYAYSLISGLITGNVNIVRIPSKDFAQVEIINSAIKKTLTNHPDMEDYIFLVKYERDYQVNDVFSSVAFCSL